MRNDIDINEVNINKMLDEISEGRLFLPAEEIEYNFKVRQFADKIVDTVFSRLEGKESAIFLFDKLLVLLDKLSFSPQEANLVFTNLSNKLSKEQKKAEDERKDVYQLMLNELKIVAVAYMRRVIEDELRKYDLPKKLTLIKRKLKNVSAIEDYYIREAFVDLQSEYEDEIKQKTDESHNRQLLTDSIDDFTKNEKIKRHKDLTIHRAILLMKHLAPRLSGCDQDKVAEVIAFLTSFNAEGIRQGMSEVKGKFIKNPESYNEDVKKVSKYLNLIGLTNETENLKRNSGIL
jgi:hypothetical protein